MDNLNFVMEDMARNLRLGSNYHCFVEDQPGDPAEENPTDCDAQSYPNGSLLLAFAGYLDQPGIGDQIVYAIGINYNFPTSPQPYAIYKSTQGGVLGTFAPLTPDEVAIDPLRSGFTVVGSPNPVNGPDDGAEPRVIIRLAGTVKSGANIQTPFNLQTSVSQRLLDR